MPWPKTSRHARGYGNDWDKLRLTILERDKFLCQPCRKQGVVTIAKAVDHITPKAKGGNNDPANLQAICNPCHTAKTAAETGKQVRPPIGEDGWPIERRSRKGGV